MEENDEEEEDEDVIMSIIVITAGDEIESAVAKTKKDIAELQHTPEKEEEKIVCCNKDLLCWELGCTCSG